FLEGSLVDADLLDRFELAQLQAAAYCALHHAVDLVPAQTHPSCHRARVGFLQPVDDQRLHQRGETTVGISPGHLDLEHSMLAALDARHIGPDERLEHARIQVAPRAPAGVVSRTRSTALRTGMAPSGTRRHS